MFVGEAPGADEDAQGVPFVGRAGRLLSDIITKGKGLDRSRTAIANAASVAILLLTSDALIAEKPKEEKGKAGHGGDYDMY